ncbi:MAG: hypothetical protein RI883_1303 [Bacteroidota bacterium]|jgi:hypothetical protein
MKAKDFIDNMFLTRDFSKHADVFLKDQKLLIDLVKTATSKLPHPYPEYGSWLITHIAKTQPKVLEKFQADFIDCILISKNQSVLRNLVNTTQLLPLIEYKESEYLDKLISFIKDDSNNAALFVYSLYKLIQFTHKYPEIKNEIEGILLLKPKEVKPSIRLAIRRYMAAEKK